MALRNPDWANKWLTKFNTIEHRNLSGQSRFFQRPAELIEDGFEMTISLVSRTDLNIFVADFLNANAGNQTNYVDFEGTAWTGYWMPEMQISRGRHNGTCGEDYRVSLRFEGIH